MKYKITYKSLDGKDITVEVKVDEFLTDNGWVFQPGDNEEVSEWYYSHDPNIQRIYTMGVSFKESYISIDFEVKEISYWGYKTPPMMEYLELSSDYLKFFDKLGFRFDDSYVVGLEEQGKNNSIEDWF